MFPSTLISLAVILLLALGCVRSGPDRYRDNDWPRRDEDRSSEFIDPDRPHRHEGYRAHPDPWRGYTHEDRDEDRRRRSYDDDGRNR